MDETGVLAAALPETSLDSIPALLALEARLSITPGWRGRASALGIADGAAQDLRLSPPTRSTCRGCGRRA